MALHIPTNLPSGPTHLVHRLRRGRTFARLAAALAVVEVRHHRAAG
jgi:hypothetical protein